MRSFVSSVGLKEQHENVDHPLPAVAIAIPLAKVGNRPAGYSSEAS
jgi:hypothetical protein